MYCSKPTGVWSLVTTATGADTVPRHPTSPVLCLALDLVYRLDVSREARCWVVGKAILLTSAWGPVPPSSRKWRLWDPFFGVAVTHGSLLERLHGR